MSSIVPVLQHPTRSEIEWNVTRETNLAQDSTGPSAFRIRRSAGPNRSADFYPRFENSMPGVPNLFSVVGPMVPADNVPSTAEQNGQWIAGLIKHAPAAGASRTEVSEAAAAAWRGEVVELFGYTLVCAAGEGANTWFMGANIEGKAAFPLFYFGPAIDYVNRCADEAGANYPSFGLTSAS
jgi:hypothetical protein